MMRGMPNPLVAFVVSLVVSSQAPAQPPAQNCRELKGEFAAREVKENCPTSLCTRGTVTGGLDGTYTFHVVKAPVAAGAPAAESVQFFVGESTLILKNGPTMTGIDTGTVDMGTGGFASLITWKDGGQIRLRGAFDPGKGMTTGDYQGTVCGTR
jgi:hypothetical protein